MMATAYLPTIPICRVSVCALTQPGLKALAPIAPRPHRWDAMGCICCSRKALASSRYAAITSGLDVDQARLRGTEPSTVMWSGSASGAQAMALRVLPRSPVSVFADGRALGVGVALVAGAASMCSGEGSL